MAGAFRQIERLSKFISRSASCARCRLSAVAEVFAGKNISVIIGFGAGGGYDMWGRIVARNIGKHLPASPT
jgi:tripartite-type tricarboxylate transporter receptor subunit TctC